MHTKRMSHTLHRDICALVVASDVAFFPLLRRSSLSMCPRALMLFPRALMPRALMLFPQQSSCLVAGPPHGGPVTRAGVWECPCLFLSIYVVPETCFISHPCMEQRPRFGPYFCTTIHHISPLNAACMSLDLQVEVQRRWHVSGCSVRVQLLILPWPCASLPVMLLSID